MDPTSGQALSRRASPAEVIFAGLTIGSVVLLLIADCLLARTLFGRGPYVVGFFSQLQDAAFVAVIQLHGWILPVTLTTISWVSMRGRGGIFFAVLLAVAILSGPAVDGFVRFQFYRNLRNPWYEAVNGGNLDEVRNVVRLRPGYRDYRRIDDAFQSAVRSQQFEIVELFASAYSAERGPHDPEGVNWDRALHIACREATDVDFVRRLLDAGADPNAYLLFYQRRDTAVGAAIHRRPGATRQQIIELLVKAGLRRNPSEETTDLLRAAIQSNDLSTIALLLKYPTYFNPILDPGEFVRLAVLAAKQRNNAIVAMLFASLDDAMRTDSSFAATLLDISISTENREVLKPTLDAIRSRTEILQPRLRQAVANGRTDLVQLLLEYGANPDDEIGGKSLIQCARDLKNDELIRLLHSHGAR